MARLREGKLLSRPRRHVLIPCLLLLAVATVGAGQGDRAPVFFEEPDSRTAERIESGIKDLARQQISDRTRGREALDEIGYWAVPPLIGLLREGDANEARNAALTLGEILDARAIEELLRIADRANHQFVPAFAVLALGKFRREALLPEFRRFVRDARKDDRRVAAVLAATKTGGPAAFELLLEVLRSEKRSVVRSAAVFCLGFFRDRALVNGPAGMVPIRELDQSLKSSEASVRQAAVLALALLGHRDLKPLYLDAVRNEREGDPEIRRIALLALGRFPDLDVTELLLSILENPGSPEGLQVMAAFLLKDRKDPAALARLKKAEPRDAKIRAALTLALSNFEDQEVAEILTQRLADRKNQVRAAAAIGLSRLADPILKEFAIRRLTIMLQEGGGLDADVRRNLELAREILRNGKGTGEFIWLGNEEFAADLPKDVEERLLDLANVEAWEVLGLNNLTDLRVGAVQGERFRVQDETSELRDLADHLTRHPYFEPADVPEPRLTITPRDGDVPAARGPAGKGK